MTLWNTECNIYRSRKHWNWMAPIVTDRGLVSHVWIKLGSNVITCMSYALPFLVVIDFYVSHRFSDLSNCANFTYINTEGTDDLHIPISIKRSHFDSLFLSTCLGRRNQISKLEFGTNITWSMKNKITKVRKFLNESPYIYK